MKDIQIISNGTAFNYRVSGAVIKNNKIMLNRLKNDDFWTFVGGKVAFGESSEKAIIREYYEETGTAIESTFIYNIFFKVKMSQKPKKIFKKAGNPAQNGFPAFLCDKNVICSDS